MMTENPPAFPVVEPGMTLRDRYAAAALTGVLARSPHIISEAAATAYKFADAMLAARTQETAK